MAPIGVVIDPRRLEQIQENGETKLTLDEVLNDVLIRDKKDMERSVAPLKQAKDALLIDTSLMSLDKVKEKIKHLVRKKSDRIGKSL